MIIRVGKKRRPEDDKVYMDLRPNKKPKVATTKNLLEGGEDPQKTPSEKIMTAGQNMVLEKLQVPRSHYAQLTEDQ